MRRTVPSVQTASGNRPALAHVVDTQQELLLPIQTCFNNRATTEGKQDNTVVAALDMVKRAVNYRRTDGLIGSACVDLETCNSQTSLRSKATVV